MEPRRRSEQAIVAVVLGAYLNAVSAPKADRLVQHLEIEGVTKDRVRAYGGRWVNRIEALRSRPLDGPYPSVWLGPQAGQGQRPWPAGAEGAGDRVRVHETGVRQRVGLVRLGGWNVHGCDDFRLLARGGRRERIG